VGYCGGEDDERLQGTAEVEGKEVASLDRREGRLGWILLVRGILAGRLGGRLSRWLDRKPANPAKRGVSFQWTTFLPRGVA